MNSNRINLDSIYDKYPDETFLIADGFDNAIIGVDDSRMIIVYSTKLCLDILINEEEMSYEDAIEHFEYNIKGAYMGKKTPLFIDDLID